MNLAWLGLAGNETLMAILSIFRKLAVYQFTLFYFESINTYLIIQLVHCNEVDNCEPLNRGVIYVILLERNDVKT